MKRHFTKEFVWIASKHMKTDHYVLICVCILSCFSCVRLFCSAMECSPPGSSVHGILQTRILEWVAMPSSGDLPYPGNWTCISCDSCIAGRFFTAEPQERLLYHSTIFLRMLCKWNHVVCSLLGLASLIYRSAFETHPHYCMYQQSVYWWIFQCMDVPQFVHPSSFWRIFCLYLDFGDYD